MGKRRASTNSSASARTSPTTSTLKRYSSPLSAPAILPNYPRFVSTTLPQTDSSSSSSLASPPCSPHQTAPPPSAGVATGWVASPWQSQSRERTDNALENSQDHASLENWHDHYGNSGVFCAGDLEPLLCCVDCCINEIGIILALALESTLCAAGFTLFTQKNSAADRSIPVFFLSSGTVLSVRGGPAQPSALRLSRSEPAPYEMGNPIAQ